MADIADRAAEQQQYLNDLALQKREQAPALQANGYCHNCDEPLTGSLLFCDQDCRDDFDYRAKRSRA